MQQPDEELTPGSGCEFRVVVDAVEFGIFEDFQRAVGVAGCAADCLDV